MSRLRTATLLLLAATGLCGCAGDEPSGLIPVRRGSLEVTLSLTGTLRPTQEQTVRTKRWGEIRRIVPHGARVRAGEIVLELDSEGMENAVYDHQIEVEVAEAELRQAEKETAKAGRQAGMKLAAARLNRELEELRLAELRARPTERERLDAASRLKLAEALQTAAEESLKIVADLVGRGFAPGEELRSAELTLARARAELAGAAAAAQTVAALPSVTDVQEAELRLQAARLAEEAAAKEIAVNAELTESKLTRFRRRLDREKDKLANARRSLGEFSVAAPNDGVVVYIPRPWGGAWQPGQSVWRDADIMSIPRLSRMKVRVQVPAKDIGDLERMSQPPARVRVPALGGRVFDSRLTWLSATGQDEFEKLDPSTSDKLGRAERQVFDAEVELTEECADLRPGFAADVEIVLARCEDALLVPMTAIALTGASRNTLTPCDARVTVWTGSGFEERHVKVLISDRFDAAVEGPLREGDRLRCAPPSVLREAVAPAGRGVPP
jgi:multidrug resistance efflux pump